MNDYFFLYEFNSKEWVKDFIDGYFEWKELIEDEEKKQKKDLIISSITLFGNLEKRCRIFINKKKYEV